MARSNESSPNIPDFFIVGQPKCGTTALYEMLERNPKIFMPEVKEPHFFVTDASYRNAPASLKDYLHLFDPAEPGQRIGEASASYLWSQNAACGIAEVQPAARIVAILREPASLLRSLHLQMLESRVEMEKDLRRALDLESERRKGRNVPRSAFDQPQLLFYSGHVRYVDQLRRYYDRFPPDQILVLIYDEFRADNEGTLHTVLRFLDLDQTLPVAQREANPTVHVRSPRLHQLLHAVSVGDGSTARVVQKGIKAVTPERLRRRAFRTAQERVAYRTPQPPNEELMAELRQHYKPEVEALSQYLNRDLVTQWGYRSVV